MQDSIIKGYYENLREGKLIGNKCNKCGGYTFPPTAACEHCGSSSLEGVKLSGEGELLFVSHSMAPPPNPRFNKIAPYAYGHIRLEEGIYVQAIINGVDISPDSLKEYFEKCPVKVTSDIIEAEGLPVLAFKIV